MGYVGGLIHPQLVEIERIDTVATEAAGDYDDIFGRPKRTSPGEVAAGIPPEGSIRSTVNTAYQAVIRLSAQIETIDKFKLRQIATGDIPDTMMLLVFSMRELRTQGLIDVHGKPTLRNNDRFHRALNPRTLTIITEHVPPLYGIDNGAESYGLTNLTANLFTMLFQDRKQGLG